MPNGGKLTRNARLAGLPEGVLQKAKRISTQFEAQVNGTTKTTKFQQQLEAIVDDDDWLSKVEELQLSLKN